MKIELKPNDYAFVFRDNGEVAIATGESAKREVTMGETLARVRQLGFQAMISGQEPKMRSGEIASVIVGMLTSPQIFGAVLMALGSIVDQPAGPAAKTLN